MKWVCLRLLCVCKCRGIIFLWHIYLTLNCQTSKITTLSELKEKLTRSTSKSYRRQKFDNTKKWPLNSNQLQCWFSFSYIKYVCSVYNYKKSNIHTKWLLVIFTPYFDVCSILSQLNITDSFFFSLTEILIFSHKKARGRKDWDNNCDRYSNLTALYIIISANALSISNISFQNVLCHWCLVHKSLFTPHVKMAVERNG